MVDSAGLYQRLMNSSHGLADIVFEGWVDGKFPFVVYLLKKERITPICFELSVI